MIVELENKWLVLCQVINPRNGSIMYKRYIEKCDTAAEACLIHDNEIVYLVKFYMEGEEK